MKGQDRIPQASREIAIRVASSLGGRGTGVILVAPPLVGADQVFKLLRDVAFLQEHGSNTETLTICFLPPGRYRDTEEFVRRVLAAWGVSDVMQQSQWDYLDYLDEGVKRVYENGMRPVIMLPQFHKALERLSWDLGARLRNLQTDYDLNTVVELPVPLSRLRDRWDLEKGKERFICSDFGQGHSTIMVKGYVDGEVSEILSGSEVRDEIRDRILELAGGIPGLVEWLMQEASNCKSLDMFEKAVRDGLVEQCVRFVQWLDREGDGRVKELVADLYLGEASAEDKSLLRLHPWAELLMDRGGRLKSSAIGMACLAMGRYGRRDATLDGVKDAVLGKDFARARVLLTGCNTSYGRDDIVVLLSALVEVADATNGLSPDWARVERACHQAKKIMERRTGEDRCGVQIRLSEWTALAKAVRRWEARRSDKDERLSDFLCGVGKGGDWNRQAIQLIAFRLMRGREIADPTTALKAVIEIPEQAVQVYCAKVLGVPVWAAGRMDEETMNGIRKCTGRNDVVPVREGERIGFWFCVHMVWAKMECLPEEKWLFESDEKVREWLAYYEKIRSPSAHSITMTDRSEWEKFYNRCLVLVERLSQVVVRSSLDDVLMPISSVIRCCLELEGVAQK